VRSRIKRKRERLTQAMKFGGTTQEHNQRGCIFFLQTNNLPVTPSIEQLDKRLLLQHTALRICLYCDTARLSVCLYCDTVQHTALSICLYCDTALSICLYCDTAWFSICLYCDTVQHTALSICLYCDTAWYSICLYCDTA